MSKLAKFIVVDATQAPFNSTLQAVTSAGVIHPFPNAVPAGSTVQNDLSKLTGFPTGTQFRIRIATDEAESTSSEVLTYSLPSSGSGYFRVSGSIDKPVITFIEIGL